ncbi:MAG: rhodanese-like domain-containing protein [Patescibacteria group bacterium]
MTEMTCEQLEEKVKNADNFILIDVREPAEFAGGNIDGAILIPLGELENKIKDFNLPPEKEIIVYCQSGRRSGAAAEILEKLGYKNAKSLAGGIINWENTL